MTSNSETMTVEVAHQRFVSFVKITMAAMAACMLLGAIGGYLVVQNSGGSGVRGIVVLMPLMVCGVFTAVPLRILRGRWFGSKEAFIAASKREPFPPQAEQVEQAEPALDQAA